jgi:hypothetical protein
MDDLTAIREFRAERDAEPPEARERVRLALDARMDAAAAEARSFGEALADSRPPLTPSAPPRAFIRRRRRVLAFAGAVAAAAIVAGTLVLNSGPTAQRASAAEILHEAAAAASEVPATSIPGPGQFLYRSEQDISVMGWIAPVPGPAADSGTAQIGSPLDYPNAYNALVSTRAESWTGDDGRGRNRQELGDLKFWNPAEEARWKAAGSPLPPPWNPEYRKRYPRSYRDALEANTRVVDVKHPGYGDSFHFPDTSELPTDPKALREAVEAQAIEVSGFNLRYPKVDHLDAAQTKEQLLNVLFEGAPSPALAAAIFNALAEVPGVKLIPAIDSLGRQGEAIRFAPEEGVRREYLFDPDTSELLAQRGVLVDPSASRSYRELPPGTTTSERDFIETGVVDSIDETPAGPKARG